MKRLIQLANICSVFVFFIITSITPIRVFADVNSDGSFMYSVKIDLPPGTKGVEPALALVYNSDSGNDIVGVGWHLTGLSHISRDSDYAINYDGNDKYAGPGGKLVKVGNYYHYKEEKFSQFEAMGTQGDGPEYWIELLSDGSKCYYGASEDSQVVALDEDHNPSIRVWALTKVEDAHGNYYSIEYSQDNGQFYPVKIVYTQGNGITKFRTVELEYEDRNDVIRCYSHSTHVKTTQRLSSITVKTGVTNFYGFDLFGDLVREYRLEYSENNLTKASKLIRVQVIGSDGSSFVKSTDFTWKSYRDEFNDYEPWGAGRNAEISWNWFVDVNGDGLNDHVYQSSSNTYVKLSTGSGFLQEEVWGTEYSSSGASSNWLVDLNGDGMADHAYSYYGMIYVKLSTGYSFTDPLPWGEGRSTSGYNWFVDVNGDGLNDHVYQSSSNTYVKLSTGSSFLPATLWGDGYANSGPGYNWLVDLNGDGMADHAYSYYGMIYVKLSTGYSFTDPLPWGEGRSSSGYNWFVDVNGDGLNDHVYQSSSNTYVKLSTGSGFLQPEVWGTGYSSAGPAYNWFADLNGDGMSDHAYSVYGMIYAKLSTGSGFSEIKAWGEGRGLDGWNAMVDFNGDGKADHIYSIHGITYVKIADAEGNGLITGISNPAGGETQVEYTQAALVAGAIDSSDSEFPFIANRFSRHLVAKVANSDGRGASYSMSYDYKKGKQYDGHKPDRKNLLFERFTEKNLQTGEESIAYYKQDNPVFHGAVLKTETLAGNGAISSRVEYQYNPVTDTKFNISGSLFTQLVRVDSVKTTSFENGTFVSENIKTTLSDDYGNPTAITETSTGLSSIDTVNTYSNDEGSWILGRLIEAKTTSDGTVISWDRFNYSGNVIGSKDAYLNPGGRWISTYFGYDAAGNTISVTDPLGHTIATQFDSEYMSFAVTVTNPLGHEGTTQYDARYGVKTAETDVNGNTTEYEYDAFGRLKKVIAPDGSWLKEIVYNDTGDAATQYVETRTADTSSMGYHYKRVYMDGLGREYRTLQKAYQSDTYLVDQVVDTEFDSKGRVSRKSLPYLTGSYEETPVYTTYQYDVMNRPVRTDYPDGTHEEFTYYASGSGNWGTTVKDKRGNLHIAISNSRGKLIQKVEPGNAAISYAYSPAGLPSSVTGPDGRTTMMTYDTFGRKLSINDPSTGTTVYEYDDAGRLVNKTDAKGQVAHYTHDDINRNTSITYSDGTPTVTYTYDDPAIENGIGHATQVSDGTSVTSFAYNDQGAPSVKRITIDGRQFIFHMEYDNRKRMTELTYPDGKTITREYCDLGLLKAVKWDGYPVVQYGRFKLDEDGEVTGVEDKVYRVTGNNVETAVAYNPLNMLPQNNVTQRRGDTPEVLENIDYAFDSLGNVTGMTDNLDSSKTQSFAYDPLNRITSADGMYGHITFEYTSYGNMTKKGSLVLNYNSDHPYAVSSDSDGNAYSYDANGNMVSRRGKTLDYDAENRLLKISDGAVPEADYAYDTAGNRIKKMLADGTIVYNIDGLYELTLMPGRDDHHTKYFYGYNNELVAQMTMIDSTLMAMHTPSVINSYYAGDSIIGLLLIGYQYANYLCGNPKTIRYFAYAVLILLFVLLAGKTIHTFTVRHRDVRLYPAWARAAAPLVIFAVFSVFGFSGCEIPYWMLGASPWQDTTMPSGVTTEGIPVEGMIFFHPDYNGNISFVTNAGGEKICQIHYRPYGEIAEKTGTDVFRHKFNSHEKDNESGLSYFKARFYDPFIGRFITPDSVVPDSMNTQCYNRYMFVNGNPMTLRDADGHMPNWFQVFMHQMTRAGDGIMHGGNHILRDHLHFQNTKSYWERKVVPVLTGVGYGILGSLLGGITGAINGFRGGFLGIYNGRMGFLSFLMDSTISLPNTDLGLGYSAYLEGCGNHVDGDLSRMTHSYVYSDVGPNAKLPAIGLTLGNVIGMQGYYQKLIMLLSSNGLGLLGKFKAYNGSIGLLKHEATHVFQFRFGGIFSTLKLAQEQLCGKYALKLYDTYHTENNLEHQAVEHEQQKDVFVALYLGGYRSDILEILSFGKDVNPFR